MTDNQINQPHIPVSRPDIGEKEIDSVVAVLRSGWLSCGPKTEEFEKRFAAMVGTKHAIAVNSGTSGLHVALRACGISEGDEVITSPFSFVASANCMLFEKAKPVFVDVDPVTFNLDPAQIEKAITPKTKAILPVHIFGQSCNMDAIMDIAQKHNLLVIEDACESPSATYKGKTVGTFGKAAVFAFYPNKQMTTGEGGMVVTDDNTVAELCQSMRNQGRDTDKQWLTHKRLGYNYRMTEMSAAIGSTQLDKFKDMLAKRIEIAEKYKERLQETEGIILPETHADNNHTWFVFPIQVAEGIDRDKVMKDLEEQGIATKAYFSPCIHLQPFYREQFGYKESDFPIAEKLSKNMLILPLYVQMTENDINRVVVSLQNTLAKIAGDGQISE